MRIIFTATILGFLAVSAGAFAAVDWGHDYDAALVTAKKDKKLVMVDLYTDWCGWCKKLDKDTYSDKDVEAKLTKDFVAVKVNPEKNPRDAKLSHDFGTTGYPHIVFVDANGKKVSEIDGYLPAAKFLEQLNKISEKATKK
jgi:thiol:disulfide interchange protein